MEERCCVAPRGPGKSRKLDARCQCFATSAVISSPSHRCSSAGDNTSNHDANIRMKIIVLLQCTRRGCNPSSRHSGITEKPTFRNSTPPIKCSSPAGIPHVITSPSRTEDHVFPYRVSCHAANDISRKRSPGIAKILLYPSLRSTYSCWCQWSTCQAVSYPSLFSQYVTGQFVFKFLENLSEDRNSGSLISSRRLI